MANAPKMNDGPRVARVREVRAEMRAFYCMRREVLLEGVRKGISQETLIAETGSAEAAGAKAAAILNQYEQARKGLVSETVARYGKEMDAAMAGRPRPQLPNLEKARLIFADAKNYAPEEVKWALKQLEAAPRRMEPKLLAEHFGDLMGVKRLDAIFKPDPDPLAQATRIQRITGLGKLTSMFLAENGFGMRDAIAIAYNTLEMKLDGYTVSQYRFASLMVEHDMGVADARAVFEARDRISSRLLSEEDKTLGQQPVSLKHIVEIYETLQRDADSFASFVGYCEQNIGRVLGGMTERAWTNARASNRQGPASYAMLITAMRGILSDWVEEAVESGEIPADVLNRLAERDGRARGLLFFVHGGPEEIDRMLDEDNEEDAAARQAFLQRMKGGRDNEPVS